MNTAASRLAGLLVLALVVGTINGLSRVALPLYAASIGAQAWQVGIVGGLGYSGLLLLALPVGAWIDRHGSRRLFSAGAAGAALLYLALPLLHEPCSVIGGVALLGLLLPLRMVPVNTEFLALLPHLRVSQAGWHRAANMTGMFFLGPALSAAAVAALGFGATFRLVAAAMLLAFVVGRRVLERPAQAAAGTASLRARIKDQLAMLARHAEMRRTMAIDFLTQMAVAYFVVFAIVLAVRHFGLSLQAAAALITVQGAAYVVTLAVGGGLLVRWGDEARYALAFVLLAAFGALFGFGAAPPLLWLGAVLMGIGVGVQGLTSVTRFAALMQRYGRGRVAGLTSIAPPAGGVIGAIGGGLLSQHFGTEAGFRLFALAYAGLALLQFTRRRS